MKTSIHYLLHQVLKRCPKSGRVVGVRRDTPLARALVPLVSLLAIAWFLLRTLGDRWLSSVLASLDPVALDSVGYDLICTEPNLTTQPDGRPNPSFNGHVDGYLHEAALAANPPSKAKYDPEGDGSTLTSLGVHEHWNNAKEMKYSRNLGKKDGIELIRLGMP